MAFPQITNYNTGYTTVDATSTTITLPTHSSGDLLMLFITKDGTALFTTPSGWTLLGQRAYAGQDLAIYYKQVSSTVSSFTISHASEMTSWISVVIPNGDIPVVSTYSQSLKTNKPDPPILNSGLSGDIMYIAVVGWDYYRICNSFPSNMLDNNITVRSTSSDGSGTAIATSNSTNSSFDPSTFLLNNDESWCSFTIGLKLKNTTPIPPIINITNYSSVRLSRVTGKNSTTITFTTDKNLTEWEVRADGSGVGSGDLIASGGSLSANTNCIVYADQLTWGDRVYRINIYGKSTEGLWNTYE